MKDLHTNPVETREMKGRVPARRTAPLAVALVMAIMGAASSANAQPTPGSQYWDGCSADVSITAQSNGYYSGQSPNASYASRWGCPHYVTDVSNTQGRHMEFTTGPSYPYPQGQQACESLRMYIRVAKNVSGTLYENVGFAEYHGVYLPYYPNYCSYQLVYQNGTLDFWNAPANKYRVNTWATVNGSAWPVWWMVQSDHNND